MKAFCSTCKIETNHAILKVVERYYSHEDMWATGLWQIIECNGCENVSFREVWKSSEDIDSETGVPLLNIKLYPIRGVDTLPLKTYLNVPYKVKNIYGEMINAFNNGLYILCAGGLRATIEGICMNENVSDGPVEQIRKTKKITVRKKDLQGKISGLFEKGLLTKNHAEILHEHRFLGNEALHSLDQPSLEALKIAIEIVEITLDNLYELPEKASDLRYEKQRRTKKN